jgi:hypothetical protein
MREQEVRKVRREGRNNITQRTHGGWESRENLKESCQFLEGGGVRNWAGN